MENVAKTTYPALNPDRIPESVKHEIAKVTFQSVLRYFEKPGVQEKFERWKAERRAHEQTDL